MPTNTQAEYTRLFENIGGALSGLRRYEAAANLIASSSYFLFVKRDEFGFFPDAADQFKNVTNLLRSISYDAADDILKLEVTEVTVGVSYSLKIVDSFGGSTIATAAGDYGVDVDVVAAINLGTSGKIKLVAPTGTPGVDQQVEISVLASAVRLSTDVTGETEEENLLEAAAIESHQITASNFRNGLRSAALNRVVVDRLLQNLVGKRFLGSDTQDVFNENQQQQADGGVVAAPSGLLAELDLAMLTNTPAQKVRQIDVTEVSSDFNSPSTPATVAGTATITPKQPTAGNLTIKCEKGFDGSADDPEEFSVVFNSTTLKEKVVSSFRLRPFRQFEWPSGGFLLLIDRLTTSGDPFSRMASPKVKNANTSRIPLNKLTIETFVDVSAPISDASTFRIIEPSTGFILFENFNFTPGGDPLPDGVKDLTLFNGLSVSFVWTNNPSATGLVTFDLTIDPYKVGDVFTRSYTIENGRLNVELRRHFEFALQQADASPTIPDSVVAPEPPFVEIALGA